MQRKRTRTELLHTQYLNTSEIARLLEIPRTRAKKIFTIAIAEDKRQLGTRQIYDTKVRIKTVLDVAGLNYNLLARQVEGKTTNK